MNPRIRVYAALAFALVAGATGTIGCKRNAPNSSAPTRDAQLLSRVTYASTNDELAVELSHVSAPAVLDPADRPLILSRPAPDSREWIVQILNQGYELSGNTSPLWDAKVRAAFEAYADYSRVSTTNWPALQKALAALDQTGCTDPMVQYFHARYPEDNLTYMQNALALLKAHEAVVNSAYHPLLKFYAGMRAMDALRNADDNSNRQGRLARTTADLEDLCRDYNAPVGEVFGAADSWLEHAHSKAWNNYMADTLEPLLKAHWDGTESWYRFEGIAEVWRGWGERIHDWTNAATDEQLESFRAHFNKAEAALNRAWQMNPSNAYTAYLMMQVELAQHQGRARLETWFQRAMALEPNYYDAAEFAAHYLGPENYGSDEEALEFARSCVASDKWGGNVPLVLEDLHHKLATYYYPNDAAEYWHRPGVWADLKSSYEKFFTLNPDASGWRENYAMDAFNCGQYSVFLEQAKLFPYGTDYSFFGGKEKFQEMIQTATKAARSP